MFNDMNGTYGTENFFDSAFAGTALTGLFAGIMIFSLILSLISIISYWKLFVKAGKPGWASIIPIYNTVVMIKIAKLPIWYIILFLVPVANIFALFKINIEMAKKFGKSTAFGVGMTLISIIFVPMLAFSDNVYEDNNVSNNTENNTFDANNVINDSNNINNGASAQVNPLDNNIPVKNSNAEIEAIEQNNIVETNISQEISSNGIEVQNEIAVAPVFTEQDSFIVEPTIEENNAEQNIINDTVNAFNTAPVMPEVTNQVVEPMIEETAVVEPVQKNETLNAFISAPVITEVNNEVVEPMIEAEPAVVEPVQNNETINSFNTVPMANEVENVVVSDTNTNDTIPLTNEIDSSKRVCKNCGNELPSIVSICPNCGTDNE